MSGVEESLPAEPSKVIFWGPLSASPRGHYDDSGIEVDSRYADNVVSDANVWLRRAGYPPIVAAGVELQS